LAVDDDVAVTALVGDPVELAVAALGEVTGEGVDRLVEVVVSVVHAVAEGHLTPPSVASAVPMIRSAHGPSLAVLRHAGTRFRAACGSPLRGRPRPVPVGRRPGLPVGHDPRAP